MGHSKPRKILHFSGWRAKQDLQRLGVRTSNTPSDLLHRLPASWIPHQEEDVGDLHKEKDPENKECDVKTEENDVQIEMEDDIQFEEDHSDLREVDEEEEEKEEKVEKKEKVEDMEKVKKKED